MVERRPEFLQVGDLDSNLGPVVGIVEDDRAGPAIVAAHHPVVGDILALEEKKASLEDIVKLMSGGRMKIALEDGDVDVSPLMVGQSIGLIHDIPTCSELIERMVSEAREHLSRAGKMLK